MIREIPHKRLVVYDESDVEYLTSDEDSVVELEGKKKNSSGVKWEKENVKKTLDKSKVKPGIFKYTTQLNKWKEFITSQDATVSDPLDASYATDENFAIFVASQMETGKAKSPSNQKQARSFLKKLCLHVGKPMVSEANAHLYPQFCNAQSTINSSPIIVNHVPKKARTFTSANQMEIYQKAANQYLLTKDRTILRAGVYNYLSEDLDLRPIGCRLITSALVTITSEESVTVKVPAHKFIKQGLTRVLECRAPKQPLFTVPDCGHCWISELKTELRKLDVDPDSTTLPFLRAMGTGGNSNVFIRGPLGEHSYAKEVTRLNNLLEAPLPVGKKNEGITGYSLRRSGLNSKINEAGLAPHVVQQSSAHANVDALLGYRDQDEKVLSINQNAMVLVRRADSNKYDHLPLLLQQQMQDQKKYGNAPQDQLVHVQQPQEQKQVTQQEAQQLVTQQEAAQQLELQITQTKSRIQELQELVQVHPSTMQDKENDGSKKTGGSASHIYGGTWNNATINFYSS
jgi:hypothetical protein